jgi:hypothetical protein
MKRPLLLLPFLFIALIAGISIMRSRAVPHGIGTQPEILSFSATPRVVKPGEPVTLAWNVRGADSLTLSRSTSDRREANEPERTNLPGSGKMVVRPQQDTVYKLTCETADGPMCATAVGVRAK